jgi:hypothetical protein
MEMTSLNFDEIRVFEWLMDDELFNSELIGVNRIRSLFIARRSGIMAWHLTLSYDFSR